MEIIKLKYLRSKAFKKVRFFQKKRKREKEKKKKKQKEKEKKRKRLFYLIPNKPHKHIYFKNFK
jgi:hypothetical protein